MGLLSEDTGSEDFFLLGLDSLGDLLLDVPLWVVVDVDGVERLYADHLLVESVFRVEVLLGDQGGELQVG